MIDPEHVLKARLRWGQGEEMEVANRAKMPLSPQLGIRP